MCLKLTQGSYSSLFPSTYLFCPSPQVVQASQCLIFPRAYTYSFLSFTSLLRVKTKTQMSAMCNWSSVVIKPFPSSPGLHAAGLTAPRTCPGGRGLAPARLCIVETCSFPSATQDRGNLVHKISTLLQAEIYRSALFLKYYKDRQFCLG